jgi:hypothetical protein
MHMMVSVTGQMRCVSGARDDYVICYVAGPGWHDWEHINIFVYILDSESGRSVW